MYDVLVSTVLVAFSEWSLFIRSRTNKCTHTTILNGRILLHLPDFPGPSSAMQVPYREKSVVARIAKRMTVFDDQGFR